MADGLKLGLYGLHRGGSADPDTLVRRARLAEEAGFESLWVGDHIALPSGLDDPPEQPRLEAVVALAYMRALWDEPTPSFQGRFVDVADVVERPRPVQRPCPPIVVGGESPAAYRRAVQGGNGWYGWDLDLEGTAGALAALRETASRYQRPPRLGELEITITPRGVVDVETARRYADLGVHRLAFLPPTMEGSAIDELIASVAETLVGRI